MAAMVNGDGDLFLICCAVCCVMTVRAQSSVMNCDDNDNGNIEFKMLIRITNSVSKYFIKKCSSIYIYVYSKYEAFIPIFVCSIHFVICVAHTCVQCVKEVS